MNAKQARFDRIPNLNKGDSVLVEKRGIPPVILCLQPHQGDWQNCELNGESFLYDIFSEVNRDSPDFSG